MKCGTVSYDTLVCCGFLIDALSKDKFLGLCYVDHLWFFVLDKTIVVNFRMSRSTFSLLERKIK